MSDAPGTPPHFTREPWWVVLVATVVMPLIVLKKHAAIQAAGASLPAAMIGAAGFGALASALLVYRSRIRSDFWSNCVLIAGILLIALGVSVGIMLFAG